LRALSLLDMLPATTPCGGWASFALSPTVSPFPGSTCRIGLHQPSFFELAPRSLTPPPPFGACNTRRPGMSCRYPKASDLLSSMPAPVASAGAVAGWAWHPLESAALSQSHVEPRHSTRTLIAVAVKNGVFTLTVFLRSTRQARSLTNSHTCDRVVALANDIEVLLPISTEAWIPKSRATPSSAIPYELPYYSDQHPCRVKMDGSRWQAGSNGSITQGVPSGR